MTPAEPVRPVAWPGQVRPRAGRSPSRVHAPGWGGGGRGPDPPLEAPLTSKGASWEGEQRESETRRRPEAGKERVQPVPGSQSRLFSEGEEGGPEPPRPPHQGPVWEPHAAPIPHTGHQPSPCPRAPSVSHPAPCALACPLSHLEMLGARQLRPPGDLPGSCPLRADGDQWGFPL